MGVLEVRPEPSSFVEVFTRCDAIETWAAECDSVAELKQSTIELSLMDQYLARTSTEGRSRVQATMRRLEARVGELLRPEPGKRTDLQPLDRDQEVDIDPATKSDFRKMAAHPEIVEEVIAQSTDEDPASRRKVIEAIRSAEPPAVEGIPESLPPRPTAARRRPWGDAYSDAVSAVEKATTTLKNLASDNRATTHSEQAIGRTNDLLRAIDALTDVANQLR